MFKLIILGTGVAVVTVAVRSLQHVPEHNRIIVGAVFALPFLLALWALSARERKAAAPAPRRPLYTPGSHGRR